MKVSPFITESVKWQKTSVKGQASPVTWRLFKAKALKESKSYKEDRLMVKH
jgi:hypothetical protein